MRGACASCSRALAGPLAMYGAEPWAMHLALRLKSLPSWVMHASRTQVEDTALTAGPRCESSMISTASLNQTMPEKQSSSTCHRPKPE